MTDRRFTTGPEGRIHLEFDDHEREFLLALVSMLRGLDVDPDDPGHQRLNVPPYLGDREASEEWQRLMGGQLQEGRERDRGLMERVLSEGSSTWIDGDDALSVLRVVNESRLALAARLGVEVPEDYESLDVGSTIALHFLGMVLEDLTDALGGSLS